MSDREPITGKNSTLQDSLVASDRSPYRCAEVRSDDYPEEEISLTRLFSIVWRRKWRVIGVTALFVSAALAYLSLAEEWYRADVLLAPTEEEAMPAIGGQLGGLAAMAGVSLGSSGGATAEAVAVLLSRDFAKSFITEYGLVREFFPGEWDEASGSWKSSDPYDWPDAQDAVEFFHDHVLNVHQDRDTQMVTLAIEWTNPVVAAAWANDLVEKLNSRMRSIALKDAEANLTYLEEQLDSTTVLPLQQAIGRLLESELQKVMIARGRDEFAFRVVDPAEPPKRPVRPNAPAILATATIIGVVLAILSLFLILAVRADAKETH